MPKDPGKPRQRPNAGAVVLAAVILLTVIGSVAFYLLGRVDPQEPASASLGWGDRVERRLDAYIDGHRPEWTDRVEERLDAFVDEVGKKREAERKAKQKAGEKAEEKAQGEPKGEGGEKGGGTGASPSP
jgi:hypothetical protein